MADPFTRLTAFMQELRRRRVFRVAAVYAAVVCVIIQIIDGTFGAMFNQLGHRIYVASGTAPLNSHI